MPQYTRRSFLRKLVLGTNESCQSQASPLVFVFLRGGADTLNMVVPYGDDGYYASRPNIAIKRPQKGVADCALKLDDFYGLHPKLAPLLPSYQGGRLAVVQYVGTDNTSGSHFETQDQIEHGAAAGQTTSGGWLGRYLSARKSASKSPLSAVAISPNIPESLRGAPNASAITSVASIQLESPAGDSHRVASALAGLYGCEVGLLKQPGQATLSLLAKVEGLRNLDARAQGGANYPDTDFGNGLREIARLIKAGVGMEVACIDLDGWDTHFFQGSAAGLQAEAINQLAQGLAAFDCDVLARGDTTVVVLTEFGRRAYENGSLGTDHGRGFALFALGQRLRGGEVHGSWSGLERKSTDNGPAGLAIKYDYRSVLCELLFAGKGTHMVSEVFPNFVPQPVGVVKTGSVPSV